MGRHVRAIDPIKHILLASAIIKQSDLVWLRGDIEPFGSSEGAIRLILEGLGDGLPFRCRAKGLGEKRRVRHQELVEIKLGGEGLFGCNGHA